MRQDQSSRAIDPRQLKRFLFEPNISINGSIQSTTLTFFLERLAAVRASNEDLVHAGRSAVCVGKSCVYSAGVTIFAAFDRANRYLTEDTVLLIHERRLAESVELAGPIQACLQIAREKLSMLKTAERLENEGFAELLNGSNLSIEELRKCIEQNCYISAEQAMDHGIISAVLR